MPFLLGLIVRGAGKVLGSWWVPLLAVAIGWVVEALTGTVSWGLFLIAQSIGSVILDVLASQSWPATPSWSVLATELATGINLLSEAGILAALQIVVLGGIVRVTVKLFTLGRI